MSRDWADDNFPDEWDEEDEHAAWIDQWAPKCPLRNPQRVAHLLGYREREPGRLQLRVLVRPGTEGICDAIVEENEEAVRVRVVLCYEDASEHFREREFLDCPVHVYLENPLNRRKVIAVDGEKELPLYAPTWEIRHNERVRRENPT